MNEVGSPILSGALSSFLAIVPLAFSEYGFFQTYYFGMFALMIGVSFLNGMVILPIICSWFGPCSTLEKLEGRSLVQRWWI
jgi:patched 1